MTDVVGAFLWREQGERDGDQVADLVERARPRGAQERFQFRERLLDRIEIGTVGGQKAEPRAGGFEGRAHLGW